MIVIVFALMRLYVISDLFGYLMLAAFFDLHLDHLDRSRGFGSGDDTAFWFLVQHVEETFGVFLIHQDFGIRLAFKCNQHSYLLVLLVIKR